MKVEKCYSFIHSFRQSVRHHNRAKLGEVQVREDLLQEVMGLQGQWELGCWAKAERHEIA